MISSVRELFVSWFVVVPVMLGLGIATGVLIFVYATPGKPQIGVIEVPSTVITERTAFAISQYIDYARRDDSIKAVVIKLSTPGGSAAASERLYNETRRLREEKPVVLVMGNLVASGGYMMSMGASYTYAQTSSLVGNVGVVFNTGPQVPALPSEDLVFSSIHKRDGGSLREWIGTVDLLKQAFVRMVVSERGDKLRISGEELGEGRLYPGLVAVQLGLADELGSQTDAVRKAADLAGIANYDFVDVNLEVLREFTQALDFTFPIGDGESGTAGATAIFSNTSQDEGIQISGEGAEGPLANLQDLRDLFLDQGLGSNGEDTLPGLPVDIYSPEIYYLYVGYEP